MGKVCSICVHKKRCQIDQSLLQSQDIAKVAQTYRVSYDALYRHYKNGHIDKEIKEAQKEVEKSERLDVHKCAREIYKIGTEAANEARRAGQYGAVGSCLGAAAKVVDILKDTRNDGEGKAAIIAFVSMEKEI